MAQLNITPAKKKKEKKLMAKMSSRVSVLIAEKKQVHTSFILNFLNKVKTQTELPLYLSNGKR
jgi:hypothetical protein